MLSRRLPSLVFAAVLSAVAACGDTDRSGPTPPLSPSAPNPVTPFPIAPDATIVAAGDIGFCGRPAVEATARLVDGMAGTVLALGDLAYPDGSARDFANCYDPTWGRHRARTRPTPGNHEYQTPNATGYFDYFGQQAGPAGRGYYSFTEGAWLIVSLNSNVPADAGSAQAAWLRSTIAQEPTRCTLAYWHHPVFSSGRYGNNGQMRALWQILEEAGADVVLVGHEHLYERFAPQTSDGRADPAGMRQFTVGTGGAPLYVAASTAPNSERIASAEGILRMTLKADSYQWEFVPIPGGTFRDSGTAICR